MQGQIAAPGPSAESPAPAASVRIERPPPGLARGREPGPAWLIAVLGGLALLVALAFYVRRVRARRRP